MAGTPPASRFAIFSGSLAALCSVILLLLAGYILSRDVPIPPAGGKHAANAGTDEKGAGWKRIRHKVHGDIEEWPLPRIDPDAPPATLMPEPLKANRDPVYLGEDLSRVPEVMLEIAPKRTAEQWKARLVRSAAVALHLNAREEDGYLKALLLARPDLVGLPFSMGAACRKTGARGRVFLESAREVRFSPFRRPILAGVLTIEAKETRRSVYQARVAAITQVFPGMGRESQDSLIEALAAIPTPGGDARPGPPGRVLDRGGHP